MRLVFCETSARKWIQQHDDENDDETVTTMMIQAMIAVMIKSTVKMMVNRMITMTMNMMIQMMMKTMMAVPLGFFEHPSWERMNHHHLEMLLDHFKRRPFESYQASFVTGLEAKAATRCMPKQVDSLNFATLPNKPWYILISTDPFSGGFSPCLCYSNAC